MDRLSRFRLRGRRSSARSISPQPTKQGYQYQPLLDHRYIRVARLLPGPKAQHLECQLINVPLEGSPIDYESVSYTWGHSDQTHSVSCDGREIPVTRALHTLIRHLRHPEEQRDLWIDQLCINQEDIAERSSQVQKMADIYKNATKVNIWIGEETKDTDLAFQYVDKLARAINAAGGGGINDDICEKRGLPKTGDKAWVALGQVMQRAWYSRSWCVQEIAMSKDAVLLCGNLSLPWGDFALAVSRTTFGASRHFGGSLYHNGSPSERVGQAENWRKWRERAKADPFQVFSFSKNCDAKDGRDKLFAFTAFANLRVKPDYSKTTEEVYVDFARSFLKRALKNDTTTHSKASGRHGPGPVVSGFLCNAGKLLQKHDLPSWAPDWSVRQNCRPLWMTKICNDLSLSYNAGGNVLGECDLQSYNLTITTHLIDRVVAAGTVDLTQTQNMSGKELQARCLEWFSEASAMYFGSQMPYVTGQSRNEALMYTLVAGLNADNTPTSTAHAHSSFYYFLNYIYQRTTKVLFSASKTDMLAERYCFTVLAAILGRVLFVTQQGYVGLAPHGAKVGDEVAIMLGGDVPLLLRRVGHGLNGPEFHLLGECFVHGLMFGEALNMGLPETNAILR